MNLGQVAPKQSVQHGSDIEGRSVGLFGLVPRRRQLAHRDRGALMQTLQHSLDACVALRDLGLIEIIQLHSLREGKDVLLPVVADQRLPDRLHRGMAARVAQCRQRCRIPLSSNNRANDGHARHAGDIRDHVMELQVHLRQRLLHVLDVRVGIVQQALTQPEIGPERRDVAFRPETGPQQAIGMQPLQPLCVADVGLAAGDMLGVAGIDEHHIDAVLIEDLEGRDPIHAGGFHRHGLHAALPEPLRQALQIGGECSKTADRLLGILVQINGCHVHRGTDVDRGSTWMGRRDILGGTGSLCWSHDILLWSNGGAGLCLKFNFLTGITAEASPLSSAQQPMDHVF